MKITGDMLKQFLVDAKFTQGDAAKIMNLSRPVVNRMIKQGKTDKFQRQLQNLFSLHGPPTFGPNDIPPPSNILETTKKNDDAATITASEKFIGDINLFSSHAQKQLHFSITQFLLNEQTEGNVTSSEQFLECHDRLIRSVNLNILDHSISLQGETDPMMQRFAMFLLSNHGIGGMIQLRLKTNS